MRAVNGASMYAGFWRRVAAVLIDGLLLAAVTAPLTAAMVDDPYRWGGPGNVLSSAIGWLYFALMESSSRQATLGKMALGIRVTDLEGERIGFGRATGRYFAKILSALILGIGFLMAAFTEKKQGLHDILAQTLVVRGQPVPMTTVVPPPPPPPPPPS
jgi:uncharacterized RDD family membrane protein YckC